MQIAHNKVLFGGGKNGLSPHHYITIATPKREIYSGICDIVLKNRAPPLSLSLSLTLIYCCTLSVEITSSVTGMMLLGNTSCGSLESNCVLPCSLYRRIRPTLENIVKTMCALVL